jgi:hypothetical protein
LAGVAWIVTIAETSLIREVQVMDAPTFAQAVQHNQLRQVIYLITDSAALLLALGGFARLWLSVQPRGRLGVAAAIGVLIGALGCLMAVSAYAIFVWQGAVTTSPPDALKDIGIMVFLIGVVVTGIPLPSRRGIPRWSTVPLVVAPLATFASIAGAAAHEGSVPAWVIATATALMLSTGVSWILLGSALWCTNTTPTGPQRVPLGSPPSPRSPSTRKSEQLMAVRVALFPAVTAPGAIEEICWSRASSGNASPRQDAGG